MDYCIRRIAFSHRPFYVVIKPVGSLKSTRTQSQANQEDRVVLLVHQTCNWHVGDEKPPKKFAACPFDHVMCLIVQEQSLTMDWTSFA
jgi:hypothetical protein